MKLRISSLAAITLLVASAMPLQITAQAAPLTPPHYKLVDLGTFGGPHSQFNFGSRIINRKGAAAAGASTSIPDPPCTFDSPYCFIFQAGKYDNGKFKNLGALAEGQDSFAIALNDFGIVVGGSNNGQVDPVTGAPIGVAVRWEKNKIVNLGTLGGSSSFAVDINDAGVTVGIAENTTPDPDNLGGELTGFPSPTQWRAALWAGGTVLDLGTLGTGPDAFALLVNKRNQVTGFSYTDSVVNSETGLPTVHAFLWENGKMTDIPSLGGLFASPSGLNDRGQVVGTSDLAGDLTQHPFSWFRGVLTDLGTLGGTNGNAAWVNDAGAIVGAADLLGDVSHHGFLWQDGVMQDLPPIANAPCSNAFGINSRGQVVGNSTDCNGNGLGATLWDRGRVFDLNTFVPAGSGIFLYECAFVGENGEIAVAGEVSNGDHHAFLLLPMEDGNEHAALPSSPTAIKHSVAASEFVRSSPGIRIKPRN